MSVAPLAGILVVDLSRHLPGPLAARLLADLGARVIKVEEPRLGDPVRLAPPRRGAAGALAALLLAGVESVALDLKRAPARRVLERLLAGADVLLETFRPGTLARLGLPPEELRRRFPRLVVCSLSGWGASGPLAGRSGHDLTYQAVAGSLAASGAMPALPTADLLGAWSAVAAILATLVERRTSGVGRWLDASLFDAALHSNLTNWAAEAGQARPVGNPTPLAGALPCYNLYPTADGRLLALAALEEKFWRGFCAATGRDDLLALQYREEPECRQRVAELVASRPAAQWQALLAAHDLPGEVVESAAEARVHPQTLARAVLGEGPDGLPRLAFPVRFDGERPTPGARLAELGEHTDAVLAELGLADEGGGPRRRRAAGIGRRFSLRRWLWRFVVR